MIIRRLWEREITRAHRVCEAESTETDLAALYQTGVFARAHMLVFPALPGKEVRQAPWGGAGVWEEVEFESIRKQPIRAANTRDSQ